MPDLDDLSMLPQVPRSPEATPPTPTVAPLVRAEPTNFQPRPGEFGEGEDYVKQAPATLADVTADDVPRDLTPLDEELRKAEELLASEPTVFGLPSLFGHPLVGLVMLALAGLLGLFCFNQVTSAVAAIQTLPEYLQYAAWAFFGLLCTAILYAMLRLTILYYRLRRNKQLRLQGLEELEKRTRLRWLINAKRHEAHQQLENYLREYPTETDRDRKKLIAVGLTGDDVFTLTQARTKLLDRDRWGDASVWFEGFRTTFQSTLDQAASRRISYWSRRAAFATAVSPNTLADTGLTLYFSFAMLADLCTIYNLRAGRLGTMVLLSRVFFNSYLAGQLNEMEGWTTDQIQQLVSPHLPATEIALGKVFSKVGAKASQGAVNYLLLSRLGKYGCRMLRPVANG